MELRAHQQQKFTLTQALHRSLEILQLPQLELATLIEEEIEKNPLLERLPVATAPPQFLDIAATPTLHETLIAQIKESFNTTLEQTLATALIAHLDERGFLTTSVAELSLLYSTPSSTLEQIIAQLQTFFPSGIFARNIRESFLIQLKRQSLEYTPAYLLVQQGFEELLQGRYAVLKKKLLLSAEELQGAIQKLARLSTRPGASFRHVPAQPIYPDLKVEKMETGEWIIRSIEEGFPPFKIQTEYLSLPSLSSAERATLRSFGASAKWLRRAIERRRKLLLGLTSLLVRKQASYLNQQGPLVPITPAELAQTLQVHESTISRALHGKYIATPRGFILLKSLVATAQDPAKEILQQLVSRENKTNPLTDDELAEAMKQKGYPIARRTIAKYRKQLDIASASTRKHLG